MTFFLRAFQHILITLCLSLCIACQSNLSDADLTHQEIITNSSDVEVKELLQTDNNRLITLEMRNNLHGLYIILNKLYKRNPREWKKTANTQALAEKHVHDAIENETPFPNLNNKKSIDALYIALSPEFKGNRAGALVYALATMLLDAHGGHSKFYISDIVDGEHLYNAARNIEIVQWMLKQRKDENGQPLLFSNEISDKGYNVSFAIEFSKMIARLDLVASLLDERYRRLGTNYIHSFVFLSFFPVQ